MRVLTILLFVLNGIGCLRAADPLGGWTVVDSPANNGLQLVSAAYGAGRFVAVGRGGFSSSADAIHWNHGHFFGADEGVALYHRVIYASGRFVAITRNPLYGSSGIITSTDGVKWVASWAGHGQLLDVAYGAGQFIAAGDEMTVISPDGDNWTQHVVARFTPSAFISLTAVAFGNGRFVALAVESIPKPATGYDNHFISSVTSADGIHWERHPGAPMGDAYNGSIAFDSGQFVVATGAAIYASVDGAEWTQSLAALDGYEFRSVSFGAGQFIVPCSGGPPGANPHGLIFSSRDGGNWSAHSIDPIPLSAVYGDGALVVVGEQTIKSGPIVNLEFRAGQAAASKSLLLSGQSGRDCTVEKSADLSSWTPLRSLQIGSNGTAEVGITTVGGTALFYRVRSE